AVFVTRHSVLMVPAAPSWVATETSAVWAAHREIPCVGEGLGCPVELPGTRCAGPIPNARERPYMPPATPARTATMRATVWTRCITRRYLFRLPTRSRIREGSG